jgi:hypothetical protein
LHAAIEAAVAAMPGKTLNRFLVKGLIMGLHDLEIVQTWDNGKFEEIDLDRWVRSSPNYLLANNFAGVPESTVGKMKQT